MKRGILILLVVALLPLAVFAQEDIDPTYLSDAAKEKMGIVDDIEQEPELLTIETPELPRAGSTKDSPFYPLDRAIEKIALKVTPDNLEKAKLHVKYAAERLAEAKKLIESNKLDLAEETVEDYQGELDSAEKNIELAKEGDVESVAEHVREVTAKHLEVLQRILEKVPDTAKPAVMYAINISQKGQEIAVQKLEQIREQEQLGEMEQEQEQEMEQEQEREGQETEEETNETEEITNETEELEDMEDNTTEESTETEPESEEEEQITKGKGWH